MTEQELAIAHARHAHSCRICGLAAPWCCRHKWTIGYVAFVVTLILVLRVAESFFGWPA